MAKTYDAIVVGSGMTGGWAAKELSEAGLETLVLEAGRMVTPGDYVEHVPPWQVRFRGLDDRKQRMADQPIQRECYACDEWSSKFFVNDHENPYVTEPDKPFLFLRGRQVGGRSIMWGRQVYRWSDLDFEANLRDGIAVDWPIRYRDIEPWYDKVERFIGISGEKLGLPQLPDGQFLKPMELNCGEQFVRDGIAKHWPNNERVVTIGRCAILTEDHNGRKACHYCGYCERGCVTLSYHNSINTTLPAARATGKMTLRPHSVVHSLIYDPRKNRVTGVRVIDGQTKHALEFRARIVFLCASTLESARILLNSATPQFPNGLANSSGEVGHNLMDHIMGGGASGKINAPNDKKPVGRRPNGIYLPRFRNLNGGPKSEFMRGYAYQGGAWRDGWGRGSDLPGFGADWKRALRDPGEWHFSLYGFGEMLPRHENYVEIDKTMVDAWGIPVLKIHCSYGDNEWALMNDAAVQAAEMLAVVGAHDINPSVDHNPPGKAIHEMGTARMGRDPKTSVLNAHNQAHDIPNLFVTDGACMASTANQNPSITYMALTARACNYAVAAMQRREI
jgi:choline dehydrogenase-like flavoprotein